MSKVKILHIGMSDNLGGIEKYLINMYRNIDKEKFEVNFLIFGNIKPCYYDDIKNDLIYITARTYNYFKYIRELKKIIKLGNFDYVHFNLMNFSCFEPILIAFRYSNSKIILHSHIADNIIDSNKTKFLDKIGKMLLKNKKGFIYCGCTYEAVEDMFANFTEYKTKKQYVILRNGININNFVFDNKIRKVYRDKLKISNNDILIGHVGRFVEQKNHKYLIEIFKKINKINSSAKLLLIGKGKLQSEIEAKVKNYKLNDKVIIIDNVENVYDYMSAMDYFLFPSLFEGLGIVLIEAQANGLNCFITDTIPKDVEQTDLLTRINISSSALENANIILDKFNEKHKDRIKYNKKLQIYDITNTIKELEILYTTRRK